MAATTFPSRSPLPQRGEEGGSFTGCFHGCLTFEEVVKEQGLNMWLASETINAWGSDIWHRHTERIFGIPTPLGAVLDAMFENVSDDKRAPFAVDTLQAMKPGADLQVALHRWLLQVVVDPQWGSAFRASEDMKPIVDHAAMLIGLVIAGEPVATNRWEELANAAVAVHSAARQAYTREPVLSGATRLRLEYSWGVRDEICSIANYFDRPRTRNARLGDLVRHMVEWAPQEMARVEKAADALIDAIADAPIVAPPAPKPGPLARIADSGPLGYHRHLHADEILTNA